MPPGYLCERGRDASAAGRAKRVEREYQCYPWALHPQSATPRWPAHLVQNIRTPRSARSRPGSKEESKMPQPSSPPLRTPAV